MAYTSTSGFKNDVFVSYAHADDVAFLGQEKGWVLNFVDDLEKLLGKKLGKKTGEIPLIWKDEELASNIPLNTSISEEIKKTATFLIIMSPAYLKSDWCQKERHQFLQILKEKGTDTRVFVIEIDEIERNRYPKEINENLVPCRFWSKEKGTEAKTLGIPTRQDEEYYTRLLDISKDLSDELDRIKANVEIEKKGSVFLAETTDDLEDNREELKRYLKDSGYLIFPDESLFLKEDINSIKSKMHENLKESLLYVQLLSNVPGKKQPNIKERITKFQFEEAKNAQTKKLIWRSSNFNMDNIFDLEYKQILESEFVIAGGFEEFKETVLKEVKKPAPLSRNRDQNSKLLYICTDLTDKEYSNNTILNAIKNRQSKTNKINCFFPLDNTESRDTRKYNEESILLSDAVLFVYCKSDPGTVLCQLRYFLKTSTRRESPFEIVALFDGPPTEKAKIPIVIEDENFIYLNCRENINDFTEKFLNFL